MPQAQTEDNILCRAKRHPMGCRANSVIKNEMILKKTKFKNAVEDAEKKFRVVERAEYQDDWYLDV